MAEPHRLFQLPVPQQSVPHFPGKIKNAVALHQYRTAKSVSPA